MATREARPALQAEPRSTGSAGRQVVWTLLASAVAGLSTYYSAFSRRPSTTTISSLPTSYALCAEDQRIYTVDEAKPAVDCFSVDKNAITATGTLGTCNQFQFDLILTNNVTQRRFRHIGMSTRTISYASSTGTSPVRRSHSLSSMLLLVP